MGGASNSTYRLRRAMEGNPVKDTRKRTGRPSRKVPNRPHKPYVNLFQRRHIVAWDGEGANLEDGTHVYNLLANSNGKYIINHGGLSTHECFQFLLQGSEPHAINVIFGGSYDVNMMLRDVPEDRLYDLWKNGTCYWTRYGIHYAHRKKFTIKEYRRETGSNKPIRSIVLWDVLGYFQTSFVKACRKWLGETFVGKLEIFDQIQDMKLQRSSFTTDKIEDIIKYNHVECKMLVLLMKALFAAMDEAGIELIRFDGAGSIAAALLRKNNVLMHKGQMPRVVSDWAQYAYSGGRIEPPQVGNSEDVSIYRYDINSAYPSAALALPSYAGCEWTFDPKWNGDDNAIIDVEWSYREEAPFYPLWYRCPDGTILYPRSGRGRYYGPEIRLLMDYYEEGEDFTIHEACNPHLALPDVRPFSFLANEYETRRRFKENGSMAHEALKLGMNSVYGKLAQQAGFRGVRIPTYHQLVWAGQITSITRAKLYRAAMQKPEAVIAFATDAVISRDAHDLPVGGALGEWTAETFQGITLVQAGVYWLRGEEEWSDKYRGFDAGSLTREEIVDCWRRNQSYTAQLTRFYGLGSAVGMRDFQQYWRVWRTEPRTLNLLPDGKRKPGPDIAYADRLCATVPTPNPFGSMLSTPYPLAWGLLAGTTLRPRTDTGLDVRTIEDELMDSYA